MSRRDAIGAKRISHNAQQARVMHRVYSRLSHRTINSTFRLIEVVLQVWVHKLAKVLLIDYFFKKYIKNAYRIV